MNDTLVPENFFPSLIVLSNTRSSTRRLKPLGEDLKLSKGQSCSEMQQCITKAHIHRAFPHSVTAAADRPYQTREKFLVWCENVVNNFVGDWLGPFTLLGVYLENIIGFISDDKSGKALSFDFLTKVPTIFCLILRKVHFTVFITVSIFLLSVDL